VFALTQVLPLLLVQITPSISLFCITILSLRLKKNLIFVFKKMIHCGYGYVAEIPKLVGDEDTRTLLGMGRITYGNRGQGWER